MNPLALALALVSAFLHAIRDMLIVRSTDKIVFSWLLRVVGIAVILPIALCCVPAQVPIAGWVLVAASAVTHTLYALSLAKAYEMGELSLVYPIARSAPVFALIWAVVVWKEPLSLAGAGGVLLVVVGAYLLQSGGDGRRSIRRILRGIFQVPAIRYAWMTALLVAAYSLIDDRAVESISPLLYLPLYGCGTCVLMLPWMGRSRLHRVARVWSSMWLSVMGAAVASLGSYLLALYALRMGNVGYVVGVRQASIVFGVLLGWRVLGESQGKARLVGVSLIAAGVILIGFA